MPVGGAKELLDLVMDKRPFGLERQEIIAPRSTILSSVCVVAGAPVSSKPLKQEGCGGDLVRLVDSSLLARGAAGPPRPRPDATARVFPRLHCLTSDDIDWRNESNLVKAAIVVLSG
jgi:hypothetical protein